MGHVIGGVRETYDRYEYLKEKHDALLALAGLIDCILNPSGGQRSCHARSTGRNRLNRNRPAPMLPPPMQAMTTEPWKGGPHGFRQVYHIRRCGRARRRHRPRLQQHDALTREIYGRSLDEILTIAIERGCDLGCSAGCAAGYKRGRTDGRRSAKGGKKSSKITAKAVVALVVGELGWRADTKLFEATATEVLSRIAVGTAELSDQGGVPEDVTRFLKAPRSYPRPDRWPQETTLRSEYSRQRAEVLRDAENGTGQGRRSPRARNQKTERTNS